VDGDGRRKEKEGEVEEGGSPTCEMSVEPGARDSRRRRTGGMGIGEDRGKEKGRRFFSVRNSCNGDI
jgi:hypothetical protein